MQNDTQYPHPTPVTLSHNSWGVLVWILFVRFRKGQASSKIAVASVLGLLIMEASRNPGLLKNGKVKSSWDVWSWKKWKLYIHWRKGKREFLKLLMGLICLFSLERQVHPTLQDVMDLLHFPAVLWIFCHVTSLFSFVLFFGIPFPPPQPPG